VHVHVAEGEALGIVGESGSGKTTLAKLFLLLERPTDGSLLFDGQEVRGFSRQDLARYRRSMQAVFQDPYSSLNPRKTIMHILSRPMEIHGLARSWSEKRERVLELLRRVGLGVEHVDRYPHEFSGGQRQRVGIARALVSDPEFVVADEPVSALDVSIQAQTVNLIESLQDELGLTMMFIAHDLAVIRHLSDRIAVMYLGKVIEVAECESLYVRPQHPYTQALLSAVPIPDPHVEMGRERVILAGDVPSPLNPPTGCRFRTRCWKAQDVCATTEPALATTPTGHAVACHFPADGPAAGSQDG
jgi:oligopeptide/dipeptide ABC transporter ATP-binding protein